MPSSRPQTIPVVIDLVRQLQPRSILDVGVGFGKWGHLFREYTDIQAAEHDPQRYAKPHWQVRIDGIEGHAAYLTEMHRFLYDHLHVGEACCLLPQLPAYDLVFMGDVIEHLAKPAGAQLLTDALARANKAVLVSTPKFETGQADSCGNELERHRSLWSVRDFHRFPGARVRTIDRDTLLALFLKPGVPVPQFGPARGARGGQQPSRPLEEAGQVLRQLIPIEAPFVLVDEEQIRTGLPHARIFPFLEKDGRYWGPPADDASAIADLERLREAGACYVAFIWSTFWWLDRYPALARHLRQRYTCVRDDAQVRVFALNKTRR